MNFRIEKKDSFTIMGLSGYSEVGIPWEESLWGIFLDGGSGPDGSGSFNQALLAYYSEPFHQIGAYDFQSVDGKTPTIIGAEYKGKKPEIEGLSFKEIPAATWAVFSIKGETGSAYPAAWARILTEWLPQSNYIRNEAVPNLDSYPGGKINDDYVWEIWFPILNK